MTTLSYILPFMERIIHAYFMLDPESKQRLIPLANKTLAIEIGFFKLYWIIQHQRICLSESCPKNVDVTLYGSIVDFLRLSMANDTNAVLRSTGLRISGDIETAEQFKALFSSLEIDWEEQLSRVTGDVLAHNIGNIMRKFSLWAKETGELLQQNVTEYLQEELNLLPSQEELQDFFTDVDVLRDDVDRMELKVKRHATKGLCETS